uniref:Uncharacterized protein n=1 Tax=Romanomermis culicivorax TaxID=13658 RepID=A0A915KK60_ROMCU
MKWICQDLLNNKITDQMEQMLERYPKGKAAIELAKQLENMNVEEEGTSEEPFVELMSEIGGDKEDPGANVFPAPPFHVLQANLPEKLWHIFELQLAEWTTTGPPWKAYEAAMWACACLFIKLSPLGRIPQNFAGFHYRAHAYVAMKLRREFNARQEGLGSNFHAIYASYQSKAVGLAYTIAKALLQDKKDQEPKYANIQVWKKETKNTDPGIHFWEVIDRKKAHDILEVEKSLKKKVGYRVKHAYNRPAASRVSKQWTKKDRDVRRKEKSQTPDKDRKRKHESRHQDESRHQRSRSREKKRRENDKESWRKEIEKYEESYERKQKDKRDSKDNKDSRKSRSQILPNTVVSPPAHFQVPQFPIMQFQPGQAPYYHQFLVPPGFQMPPPTIIRPIRNVQSKERMDIPGISTGTQPPQRPLSTGNPDYISPLKRET